MVRELGLGSVSNFVDFRFHAILMNFAVVAWGWGSPWFVN